MLFNIHSDLRDKHAFLSPSSYHWVNYDEDKLFSRYIGYTAAQRGSDLHKLAHEAIRLNIKLSRGNKALYAYVSDGIAYKMTVEPTLFYSYNCFGTPDTLSFRRGKLRIHDLKTGIVHASERQLEIYAALFCLEYNISPYDIEIELRIYQREDIRVFLPPPELIEDIMDKIVLFDQRIEEFKLSERF
jgi:hypothetical protein